MIDLTTAPIAESVPRLLQWGSELTPTLGGVTQRLDRLGSRHGLDVQMPPMRMADEGRRWISRLLLAKQEGGRIAFPQVDFEPGPCGRPTVSIATASGRSIPITGATAYYTVREGQWLSVTHAGRSYLYCATAQVVLNGSGAGAVPVDVLLRSPLSVGDAVELSKPVIEGWLSGDGYEWTLERSRTVGLGFTIVERA
ncbi:hypothetical protein ASE67_02660 [Sphingomonas sp. Leaf23]|uniref:hypothetical protein n=1 Tax=Sphingomonas sp. Leaf23 TaxID=1735689 RepID=UPI0006F2136F|nr:hypothetical protein [Sphingomonas sp. Leaf23]KQM88661.1 hypothetical protein ASE67_02660 [Sphingomonas sp. Leaf23]